MNLQAPCGEDLASWALPRMTNLTAQVGYFSQAQKIRRFRYEDNNVAIAPVQPHYYCVRWVEL